MTDMMAHALFSSLGMAIFALDGNKNFTLQTGAPEWLLRIVGRVRPSDKLDIFDLFPALSPFDDDPGKMWSKRGSDPAIIGHWVSRDASGNTYTLIARTVWVERQRILTIAELDAALVQAVKDRNRFALQLGNLGYEIKLPPLWNE